MIVPFLGLINFCPFYYEKNEVEEICNFVTCQFLSGALCRMKT